GMMTFLPAWRQFDPLPILTMNKQEKEAWTRRVKEAAQLEAHEHQGLDQILAGHSEKTSHAKTATLASDPSDASSS
ncbi:MAG: hypothetical protein OEY91_01265, partial [Nitrospirota bacterium]|nr:hypothetical protein [Nitrospirota bacterium]